MTKDDMLTQMFFSKLVNNENSMIFSAYESDVEDLFVFVYIVTENDKNARGSLPLAKYDKSITPLHPACFQ